MPGKRRRVRKQLDSCEVMDVIEAHFAKRFRFTKTDDWVLPRAELTYESGTIWINEGLASLKLELNRVKDQLSDLDIVRWREHTQNENLTGFVVSHLKATVKPELCTQAWCKFYEILCSYPFVNWRLDSVRSVHLCEAPGAFVAALNHYMAINHPDKRLSWLATTLNPYYEGNRLGETIPDDRFILPTFSNWEFGRDNTGNIFSSSNRFCLIDRAQSVGAIHLVTADGSIDCQEDPSEQERTVSRLHVAETVAAFRLLSSDGCFVLKMFTCFEHSSICLLYLLNCAFREVHVCKPGTSKRGNSEVYVVCLGYCGSSSITNHLAAIDAHLDNETALLGSSMFPKDAIPDSFLRQMTSCCEYFVGLQIEAIRDNLQWYESTNGSRNLNRMKSLVAREFVRRFGIGSIPDDKVLVGAKKLKCRAEMYRPLRVGSYNERRERERLPWQLRLTGLEQELKDSAASAASFVVDVSFGSRDLSSTYDSVIVVGQAFQRCLNSPFCTLSLLKVYNDVRHCAREANLKTDSMVASSVDAWLISRLAGSNFEAIDEFGTFLAAKLRESVVSDGTSPPVFVGSLVSRIGTLSEARCDFSCFSDRWRRLCLHANHLNDRREGSLLIVVDPPLSRISVGFLYVLWQSFGNLSLWSANVGGQQLEFAFCTKRADTRPDLSLLQKLDDILGKLDLKDGETVLEIVSVRLLLDGSFYTSVRSFADKCLAIRSHHLVQRLASSANTTDF